MKHDLRACAAGLAALLCACGGGDEPAGGPAALAYPEPLSALYADDGSLMPALPRAVPADAAAQVRSGLYAVRAQAEMLHQALPGRVIWVDADCCDDMAVEFAVATAQVLQITLGLDNSAPVFVTGSTPRVAAAVVNQLADTGMSRVFLVAD